MRRPREDDLGETRRDFGAAGLGALSLGLLTAPWVYAGFGALTAFPPPFAQVATPLLIVATLDLAWEAFARPRRFKALRLAGAALSAIILLAILSILTELTLLRGDERVGLLAPVWLGAAAVWLWVSLLFGQVGPQAILRLQITTPIRRWAALAAASILFGVLSVLTWRYLATPPAFIG